MADDPEFPCCSCERLMQRKQVTAFKFSDSKFFSNMWENLKDWKRRRLGGGRQMLRVHHNSRAVQKGKRKISASAFSNSLSPSSKKTKSTLKRKNNTPPQSPSVVCVSSPRSQTKQKKMTPSSPGVVCISSPQAQVYKQTVTPAPMRACKRRLLSAGQPMPTKRPPSPDIVCLSSPQPHTIQKEKMTQSSPDVVHISSPQAHIHQETVTCAPTGASKRRILSAGQPMPTKRADFVYNGPKSNIPIRLRYNPVSPDWQRQACHKLRLRFVSENGSVPGGPDVPLTHSVHGRKMNPDGNCLFRALSYIITGSERQHFQLRSLIVEHVQFLTDHSLPDNLRDNLMMLHSLEAHIARTNMALDFVWGTDIEVAIACHLLDVNIVMYCVTQGDYVVCGPWLANVPQVIDNTRPTKYISFTGNHFDVMLSQE